MASSLYHWKKLDFFFVHCYQANVFSKFDFRKNFRLNGKLYSDAIIVRLGNFFFKSKKEIIQSQSTTSTYILTADSWGQNNHFFMILSIRFRWKNRGGWKSMNNFEFQLYLPNHFINHQWFLKYSFSSNLSRTLNSTNIFQFLCYDFHIPLILQKFEEPNYSQSI